MSAHTCKTLTDGCYRCDLNRDEIATIEAEIREDAQRAWRVYRAGHPGPRRQLRKREFINGYLAANDMEPDR